MSAFIDAMTREYAAGGPEFVATLESLSEAQLRWRPGPKQWSVGEITAHLVRTETQYRPAMADAANRVRALGLVGESDLPRHSLVGKLILRGLRPESTLRIPAPKVFAPPAETPADIAEQYATSRAGLLALAESLRGLPLEKIRFATPVSPLIRLNAADGLRIMVLHDLRHRRQIERVRSAPGFPAA